jgi:hypothetical protein
VPTVTLFTQAFAGLADAVFTGAGATELPRVVLPHPLNDRPEPDIRAALRERAAAILGGLTC